MARRQRRVGGRYGLIAPGVALLFITCGEPPSPRLHAIEPDEGPLGTAVPVRILGEEFLAAIRESMGERASVDEGFRAWLGDQELVAVQRIDSQSLTAVVPASLREGVHELRIEGPYGSAILSPAYAAIEERGGQNPIGGVKTSGGAGTGSGDDESEGDEEPDDMDTSADPGDDPTNDEEPERDEDEYDDNGEDDDDDDEDEDRKEGKKGKGKGKR